MVCDIPNGDRRKITLAVFLVGNDRFQESQGEPEKNAVRRVWGITLQESDIGISREKRDLIEELELMELRQVRQPLLFEDLPEPGIVLISVVHTFHPAARRKVFCFAVSVGGVCPAGRCFHVPSMLTAIAPAPAARWECHCSPTRRGRSIR